jgi:hypothetical protein
LAFPKNFSFLWDFVARLKTNLWPFDIDSTLRDSNGNFKFFEAQNGEVGETGNS